MSINARLLESHDPSDWHENKADELLRQGLTPTSSHDAIRMGYPLQARLVKQCPFSTRGPGHVFRYARTSWAPSSYPIQVWAVDASGTHQWCYNSSEVDVFAAEG